jgi:hypothetical protein
MQKCGFGAKTRIESNNSTHSRGYDCRFSFFRSLTTSTHHNIITVETTFILEL